MEYSEIIKGKLLGSGVDGHVYQYGTKRAIKITREAKEGPTCAHLVGHTMRNVVKIYNVFEVKTEFRDSRTAIVMELLQPLSGPEKRAIMDNVPQYGHGYAGHINWDGVLHECPEHKKLIKSLRFGGNSLAQRGLYHNDLHWGNVMKSKRGVYKIIDLSIMNWR